MRIFSTRDELEALCTEGFLGHLITVFSRDIPDRYYVQHAIEKYTDDLCILLNHGGYIYLCSNRRYLEDSVSEAIENVADFPV